MRVTKSRVFRWAREHTKLVAGVSAGAVLGLAGSAVVMASIPDANGVIHACYTTNNTSFLARVRIIDSPSQTCSNNETAISWNQQGPAGPQGPQGQAGPTGPQGPAGDSALAYGFVYLDDTTNEFVLKKSASVTNVTEELDVNSEVIGVCLTVTGTPENMLVTFVNGNTRGHAFETVNGWFGPDSPNEDGVHCADDTNANVWLEGTPARFFRIY
jgi:hypothetical protein